MKKSRILCGIIGLLLCVSILSTTAFAAETNQTVSGYLWNSQTGELRAYVNSPEECLPMITMEAEDFTPYVNPVMTRGVARAFYSYEPNSYTYDYQNSRFKIGMVRVDNSGNHTTPAALVFAVDQSGSCSVTLTLGASLGGEVNAIFSKAQLTFGGEVASQVSWSQGTRVETNSSVPPGQIGRVTAYVVGIYSAGTTTYTVLNTTTDELWYDSVGIGVLIPTTNEWNLVVEIPCAG